MVNNLVKKWSIFINSGDLHNSCHLNNYLIFVLGKRWYICMCGVLLRAKEKYTYVFKWDWPWFWININGVNRIMFLSVAAYAALMMSIPTIPIPSPDFYQSVLQFWNLEHVPGDQSHIYIYIFINVFLLFIYLYFKSMCIYIYIHTIIHMYIPLCTYIYIYVCIHIHDLHHTMYPQGMLISKSPWQKKTDSTRSSVSRSSDVGPKRFTRWKTRLVGGILRLWEMDHS